MRWDSLEDLNAEYGPETGAKIHDVYMAMQSVKDEDVRNAEGWDWLWKLVPDEDDFIQLFFWLRPKRAGRLARLIYRKAQRDLVTLLRKAQKDGLPLYFVILKSRQLGFSTLIEALFTCRFLRNSHAAALVTSYNDESSRKIFTMTDRFIKNLPFHPPLVRTTGTEFVTQNDSTFTCIPAGAKGGGKSLTINDLHCSEFSIYNRADSFYDDVMQTLSADPFTRAFYEATANGMANEFAELWFAAAKGKNDFIAFFAGWLEDPDCTMDVGPTEEGRIMRSRTKDEIMLQDRFGASVPRLAWRRWAIRNKCAGSAMKFRQSYPAFPEEAFLASGHPSFDQGRLLELMARAEEPVFRGRLVTVAS